ncbi:MAG: respiratory nitrate reductase subunit gamma [Anaerolineae bacterium]|nr:respiratory nitrate reductase subunit gamma [Anaerolineae bacterium]
MLDLLLFAVFPYVAVVLAVVVGMYRYFNARFSYSSYSSQFLETRALFWGSVPWHYGIIVILLAHLLAALFPDAWAALIAEPGRLYALELVGLALGLLALVGMALLIARRLYNARIRSVTSLLDWVLLAVLLAQVALGVWVALFYRWGSAWYLSSITPWLRSLTVLQPQIDAVVVLPLVVKLHALGGFVIIALFPFTRLVHLIVFPLAYLWRAPQVVIWNRRAGDRRRG